MAKLPPPPKPAVFCPHCGVKFTGLMRQLNLRNHIKSQHPR